MIMMWMMSTIYDDDTDEWESMDETIFRLEV